MPLPRFVTIDGRRYLWRDLVALRQAQTRPRPEQPTLFELREDHRPPGERNAAHQTVVPLPGAQPVHRAGAAKLIRNGSPCPSLTAAEGLD